MVLYYERKLLNEVYRATDEALEFASSLLRDDDMHIAQKTHDLWENGGTMGDLQATILHPESSTLATHSELAARMATILARIYQIQHDLKDLEHDAHLLTEGIREVHHRRALTIPLQESADAQPIR